MHINKADLIISYRDYYGQYHNHKEQMAFSAAALYLTSATALVLMDTCTFKELMKGMPLIAISLSAVLAFIFICWQLENRILAAAIVKACDELLADIEGGCDLEYGDYKNIKFPKLLIYKLEGERKSTFVSFFKGPWISTLITLLGLSIILCFALLPSQSS
jgi:hypothetical protein